MTENRPIRISRTGAFGRADYEALGVRVIVLTTDPRRAASAALAARRELDQMDEACGPDREGAELRVALNSGGRPVTVSPLLADVLGSALQTASESAGAVDPTGTGAWEQVRLNRQWGTLQVPAGIHLDVAGPARAWGADRAAIAAGKSSGAGVLVSVGGDARASGPAPGGGWNLALADPAGEWPAASVHLDHGGLFTIRARRGSAYLGASVAAPTCGEAQMAAAVALQRGEGAEGWLRARGYAARLIRRDGSMAYVGRWPSLALAA